jgi:TPR repeat protein
MYLFYLVAVFCFGSKLVAVEASITSKTDYEQAIAYQNGDGVSQDSSKAFDLFLQCAKRGDPRAEYKAGVAYFNGEGVPKDQVEGLAWMYNAVKLGISAAVCASMEESIGAEMCLKAKERAKELSSSLHPSTSEVFPAQQSSSRWYDARSLSNTDFEKMAKQIRENAITHNTRGGGTQLADAQMNNHLGVQYEKGDGIPKNFVAAAEYYKLAADRSYPSAQYNLARLYLKGQGVPLNLPKAAKYFRQAADQGNAKAQQAIGRCYALGEGVPKNLMLAYMWFNIAAANGHKGSAANRELAAQYMTPSQIEEAQRLSSEWTPQPHPTP